MIIGHTFIFPKVAGRPVCSPSRQVLVVMLLRYLSYVKLYDYEYSPSFSAVGIMLEVELRRNQESIPLARGSLFLTERMEIL